MNLAQSIKKIPVRKLPLVSSQKKTKSELKQNLQSLLNDLNAKSYDKSLNFTSSSKTPIISQDKNESINEKNIQSDSEKTHSHSSSETIGLSNLSKNKIHFQLITKYLISIEFEPKSMMTSEMKEIIEEEGGEYDKEMKLWIIPFESYEEVLESLNEIKDGFSIKTIPELAFEVHKQIEYTSLSFPNGRKTIEISYEEDDDKDKSLDDLSDTLKKGLYEFQKEGVLFGIKKHGRLLLADEMGIGKTIQAISLCQIYRENWPVLVVCPSSVKYLWKNELIKWLDIKESDVQIVNQSKIKLQDAEFYIISYDLIRRIDLKLKKMRFEFVILDESHCIKNKDSLRSFYLVPIAQRAKRVLLLSGTPLLAKPIEGFTMLSILRPDIFTNFQQYGNRYCDPQPTAFGINWSGASNTKELHFIFNTLMIRRLKKDVLDQLPPKRRMKLEVDCNQNEMEKIKDFYSKNTLSLTIPDIYLLTGLAKIKGIKRYINDLLEAEAKFIVFGHHHKVLDAIEETAIQANVYYIRIDGSVKNQDRYDLVNEFQTNQDCKIAILSINAAATGITLTASSMVIFAELTWTPAIMIQAEDRAHRIGQKNDHLDIVYLYGKNTIDDFIFKKLEQKLKIVSTTLDDIQSEWAFRKKKENHDKSDDENNSEENISDDDDKTEENNDIDITDKIISLCHKNANISSSDLDTASVSNLTDLGLDINLHEINTKRQRQLPSNMKSNIKENTNKDNYSEESDNENNKEKAIKLSLYT